MTQPRPNGLPRQQGQPGPQGSPAPQATPRPPSGSPDPLQEAEAALQALPDVPLDQHAEVFTRIDAHLRKALDGAGSPGRG